jgi:hypothetical protein
VGSIGAGPMLVFGREPKVRKRLQRGSMARGPALHSLCVAVARGQVYEERGHDEQWNRHQSDHGYRAVPRHDHIVGSWRDDLEVEAVTWTYGWMPANLGAPRSGALWPTRQRTIPVPRTRTVASSMAKA